MKRKVLVLSLLVLFIDQLLKALALEYLSAKSIMVIGNFFSLDLVFNTGASWGILNDSRWVLIIISIIILGILLKYLWNAKDCKLNIIAFFMLCGGLLGNLVDRVFRGFVIDYIALNFWGYHFPIFNCADIMIVLGTVLLAIQILKGDV